MWDHLTNPATRSRIFDSEPGGTSTGSDGRMGEGGAYVCAHGKYRVPHRIVEWIPMVQYTFESENPHFRNLWLFHLTDLGDRTRLDVRVGETRGTRLKLAVLNRGWKRYTIKTTNAGLGEFAATVEAAVTAPLPG